MELTLDEALQKAVAAHKVGQVNEANDLYTAIIEARPKHPDANHNMGVLALGVGKVQEALPFFKTALEANPSIDQFWLSYIDALIKSDDVVDAKVVLAEARGKGIKGEVLDQLEQKLNSPNKVSIDPPQDQLNRLINLYQLGQLQQALDSTKQLLSQFPDSFILYNLCGAANKGLGQLQAAIDSYKQALKVKPDYADAYNNMGTALKDKGDLDVAIDSYKKAIKIKPDYAGAHYNLGVTLQELGRLDEAEASYTQAIALKPDYAEAHTNLGCLIYEKGDVNSALHFFEKAFELDSELRINELRLMVLKSRATHGGTAGKSDTLHKVNIDSKLDSNPLILSRAVEIELIEKLYEMTSRKLDSTKDARFGNGSCSPNFQLFEDESSIIKTVSSDLIRILSDAVKSKTYVYDSFFNILGAGGGSHPHDHIKNQDNPMDIWKQKYSLVYYLSVGDQDCNEPGVLKFYSPDEDILPCEGMIVIVPATRQHSAVYSGKTDRIMIGVNFYAL